MPSFKGKIMMDEDGALCLKMRIAPMNPEEYEIPFEELFEDYIDKRVKIDVLPVKSRMGDK